MTRMTVAALLLLASWKLHSWWLGAAGGLLTGLAAGQGLALSRLGAYEQRERARRIANWRK